MAATKLTPEQKERKALAEQITKLRAEGKRWDGDEGICKTVGIKGAPVGRALLREFGHADQVKPLSGKRLEQQQEARERNAKLLAERKAKREAEIAKQETAAAK